MNYYYNITFVVQPKEESKFLEWVRNRLLKSLLNPESPARNASLKKVVEAGGSPVNESHGLSIALQVEFANEKDAHEWHDVLLLPQFGEYTEFFGQDASFFVTLLESVPL